MKRTVLAHGWAAATIALAFLGMLSAQGVEVESPGITRIVRQYFPNDAKGGLAVLVIKNRNVIHSKGYGVKNGKEPVTSETRLGLASVTKQFAAMCAAILIEEGRLSLTDKVSQHLRDPQFPRNERELLVQDLVWHTSGLANFIKSKEKAAIEAYKKKRDLTRLDNKTHAAWLATMPLRRAPGMEWEYTNSGYVLLARIVEVVSGQPFHEFQKERILAPLGMTNTRDSTRFNGSGNMTMSLEDYAKWDRALWDGALLNEATSKLLTNSGQLDNGDRVGYGFGWHVVHENGELIEMWHGGAGSAPSSSRNMVLRDIPNEITVAFFARENLKFTKSYRDKFAREIRDHVRGLKPADHPQGITSEIRATVERMRRSKPASVSGGSLRSGLLKHAAELPGPRGAGYHLAHPNRKSNYGNDRLVYGLMMLGARLQETLGDHPFHQLCVRDLSERGGGKIKFHINHQMGLDADLTFFATDRLGYPVSSVYTSYGADGRSENGDRQFDVARNWLVVRSILENEFFGNIRAILISNPLKRMLLARANTELRQLPPDQRAALKAVIERADDLMRQPSTSPHDNHFHLSLKL